jgi:phosphotransacetylase
MYMGSPYYVTGYGYYTVMGTGSAVTFGPVTLGNQTWVRLLSRSCCERDHWLRHPDER